MLCINNRLSNIFSYNRMYTRDHEPHLYSSFYASGYVFVSDKKNMPAKLAHFATKRKLFSLV